MLFDCCRARADSAAGDVVPMDFSMLGKDKGKKGKCDKKGKGKGESNQDEKDKGKGKGKANAKATEYRGDHLRGRDWEAELARKDLIN